MFPTSATSTVVSTSAAMCAYHLYVHTHSASSVCIYVLQMLSSCNALGTSSCTYWACTWGWVSVRTFSVMYDHTLLNLQITNSDIRPHIKWAGNLVMAYGYYNRPQGFVYELTHSLYCPEDLYMFDCCLCVASRWKQVIPTLPNV